MLVGDNVLVQDKKGNIFRPSDVGEPIDIAGSWTLRFNNSTDITTFGSPEFLTFKSETREGYTKLDNLGRNDNLGYREPIIFPDVKWKSKIDLAEYTHSGTGSFDIGDLKFAYFAGWFCKCISVKKDRPDIVYFKKNKVGDNLEYLKFLGLDNLVEEVGINYYFKKCYLTELIDALFDYTGTLSIPDEIIFSANDEWIEAFRDGFFSQVYYDIYNKSYVLHGYNVFLSDLSLALNKVGHPFDVIYRSDGGNVVTSVRFSDVAIYLRILDGWENEHLLTLYDIGKGEFNVSGITMREL